MMPPPMPTITFSASPATITLGQSATLNWTTMNASSCSASGAWSGSEGTSGPQTVTPTTVGMLTYTLTCTGPAASGYGGGGGGTAMMSATLTVNAAFAVKSLVSDTTAGGGAVTDSNLVNPWGLVFGPTVTNAPVWIANNGSRTSTLYDGNGQAQQLVVALPDGFDPSGIVFNGNMTEFQVSKNGATPTAALFIYSGEGGMLAGWSPNVDRNNVVVAYADAGGAVYTGLAIAQDGTADFLYATDFANGKVDVFDSSFHKQTPSATSFTFQDPNLPSGFAPFGIQAIGNGPGGSAQIYIAYAMRLPGSHDDAAGPGEGAVDVFDANGQLVKQLIPMGGALNAPWGMALAPSDFGVLGNALLIGNFGDGHINAYDPATGRAMGAVTDGTGAAFAVPGLWGIAFGNDAASLNQPHNTLFFTAGTHDGANGVYGRIDAK